MAFGVEATGISGDGAVGTDDSVARDEDGEGIGSDGVGYGSHCTLAADGVGHLTIGHGRTVSDGRELLPHLLLERCANHEQRNGEGGAAAVEIVFELGDCCAKHVQVGKVVDDDILFDDILCADILFLVSILT